MVLSSIVAGNTPSDIKVLSAINTEGKITAKTIETALEKAGFTVSVNRDMNKPFMKQFKSSSFDTYNLLTFYQKETVLKLVKKYPHVGLFAPMSLSIYTKKGENTISVSSLSAEAMAKVMNAPSDDDTLQALHQLVQKTLRSAMPKAVLSTPQYTRQKPQGELVTQVSMEMDKDEWEDELDELKIGFEGELALKGFVMAGFNNLGDEFEESNYEAYDFYEVYSICKLVVIYTIAQSRPEAGAYAPCSLYFSKKKDDTMLHIAFPSVYNWMSSMAIDKESDIKVLKNAQSGMQTLLTELTSD
jgi:uncharacterized protein (DUF302 family)